MVLETENKIKRNYEDDEMAIWIKAGSIIPILNHKRELSLKRALPNPIILQIYID